MKVLLIYPKYPKTFWGFGYALKFIKKRATYPPLGLITIASMLPSDWDLRLIDMNVTELKHSDLKGVDCVLISAMSVQAESAREVIDLCKERGIATIAGGPLFTTSYEEFDDVKFLILDEAEVTMPLFLNDLAKGEAKHLYTSDERADLTLTPLPLWGLINMKLYASMNLQYSRGCPFNCEFCNITSLFGRVPRTKNVEQVVLELEHLYQTGWRGGGFFVDDNFIGNKTKLKKEVLPAIIEWQKERGYPFALSTEASINLADDEELLGLMVEAGFDAVFVGIETTHVESLRECNKSQNCNRDLVASVRKIQKAGMEVQAGFIVGFDSDPEDIFDQMIAFIQESRVGTAMVGLLNAVKGTNLYNRLIAENRMLKVSRGNNTDFKINFVPKMDPEILLAGYQKIMSTIYSPKVYYARISAFIKEHELCVKRSDNFDFNRVMAGFKAAFRLGVIGRERFYFWKLILWTVFHKPELLAYAVTQSIFGYHFRKMFVKNDRS